MSHSTGFTNLWSRKFRDDTIRLFPGDLLPDNTYSLTKNRARVGFYGWCLRCPSKGMLAYNYLNKYINKLPNSVEHSVEGIYGCHLHNTKLFERYLVRYKCKTSESYYLMLYISLAEGGARGVMVIVLGNGHCDKSSNPGRDCILHCANTLGKGMNPIILPPAMGK